MISLPARVSAPTFHAYPAFHKLLPSFPEMSSRPRRAVLAGALALLLLLSSAGLGSLQAQTAQFSYVILRLGGGFSDPAGVAVDRGGNVYVADVQGRKVYELPPGCASSSCVTALGGGFVAPRGVAVDGFGNVYVADRSTVKEMPAGCNSSGCVTTLGGVFPGPDAVAVDGGGNVYVADTSNNAVKEMPPGCASSSCVTMLGGGFTQPSGLALDGSGNIYVADSSNNAVKEMPPGCASSSCVTTLGGGFSGPSAVAVDGSGNVYVVDSALKEMPPDCLSTSCVMTLGSASGLGVSFFQSLAIDQSGDVYVGGSATRTVQELKFGGVDLGSVAVGSTSSAQTLVFTFTGAGSGVSVSALTQGATGLDFADAGTGTCDTNGTGHAYIAGNTCTVNATFSPTHPGPRMGAVQLLNSSGSLIATALLRGIGSGPQVVFPSNNTPFVVGSGFNHAQGVAVDAIGDVFVADAFTNTLYEIVAVSGQVSSSSTVNTVGSGFFQVWSAAVDASGDVFVADTDHTSVKEIVAGTGGAANGQVSSTSTVITVGSGFAFPRGVAVDGSGNIFVADTNNNAVKEIVAVNGQVSSSSTVITLGSVFNKPYGVAVDASGDVFVADTLNRAVKEIVAGTGGAASGQVSSNSTVITVGSGFSVPATVAVDADGDVFVADTSFSTVFEIVAVNGQVSSSSTVITLGSGFDEPYGVAVDASGNVFVADYHNSLVKEIPLATPPSLSFATTAVGSQSSDSPQSIIVQNIGNQPLTFPVPSNGENPAVAAGFTLDSATTCPEVMTSSSAGALAAGEICNLAIDFIPITATAINGSVMLTDNNLNVANATQSIGLSGTGFGGTPTVTWPAASAITYGQTLASSNLIGGSAFSGSTAVPGVFAFTNPATVPAVGAQLESVTFTPTDLTTYTSSATNISVQVNQATPTVTWPAASAITYGQTLASSTISGGSAVSGSTSVPGSFAFTIPSTAPGAGTQSESITFIPTDSTDYAPVTSTVSVLVNKATPTVMWPAASVINYGQALTSSTLSGGSASGTTAVQGAFTFTMASTVPGAGTQSESVSFTPNDRTDYASVASTVSVIVNKAPLTVTASSSSQPYGSAIPALTANIAGFVNGDPASVVSGGPTLSTLATSASLPGTYSITVGPGTLSAANYSFNLVAGMLTVTYTASLPASGNSCNGAYSGTFNGNVTLSAGQTCSFVGGGVTGNITQTGGTLILVGATVTGDVQIQQGSMFSITTGSYIKGNLQVQHLPASTSTSLVCGSTVHGDLQFQNNAAPVEIGTSLPSAGGGCTGNTINGNLTIQSNTASVSAVGNTVGVNLTDQGNSAQTMDNYNTVKGNLQNQNDTSTTQVFWNTIGGNLQCQGDSSIIGGNNTAISKQGQCATF